MGKASEFTLIWFVLFVVFNFFVFDLILPPVELGLITVVSAVSSFILASLVTWVKRRYSRSLVPTVS